MIETLYQSEFYWLILSFIGFITGVICAMGGSGGLIITPFLIASGMPVHIAIGSAKLSSLGMWAATLLKFKNADKIQWKYISTLVPIALIGGSIGSLLTLSLDKEVIYPIVGLVLIIIAPLGLIKKDFGINNIEYSASRKSLGYTIYFLIMIFGGFFGAGAMTLAIMSLITFFGLTAFQSHATQIIPWVTLTIISSAIFAYHGSIDYMLSATLFLSMTLGGWVGAHFAIKGSDKWVKIFTFSFAFLIGCKLLFETIS